MNKKEEILEATCYYFSKYGYNASLSDIAKRVGIKTPSLYSHFENKGHLFYLAVERELTLYFTYLNHTLDSLEGMTTEEKLKTIILSVFEYFNTIERLRFKRNIALIENEEIRSKCKEFIRLQEKKCSKKIMKIFRQGVQSGELREDTGVPEISLYFAMLQGMLDAMLLFCEASEDMQDYIINTVQAYWKGIKAPEK